MGKIQTSYRGRLYKIKKIYTWSISLFSYFILDPTLYLLGKKEDSYHDTNRVILQYCYPIDKELHTVPSFVPDQYIDHNLTKIFRRWWNWRFDSLLLKTNSFPANRKQESTSSEVNWLLLCNLMHLCPVEALPLMPWRLSYLYYIKFLCLWGNLFVCPLIGCLKPRFIDS